MIARMAKIVAWSVVGGAALIAWVIHSGDTAAKPPARERRAPEPRIVRSLPLPGPGIHVLSIPNDSFESTPCVVAVTDAGHVSASCGTREIDLGTPDER